MSPAKVILVDDEEDIRLSVEQALEIRGFEVTSFARAERALDLASRTFDGVIISDIRMPKMDGLQFLSAVREIDPDLPVILITGHGDVPLAVEALRGGAYDFIEKPFPPDRLGEAVRRAIDLRRLTLENRVFRERQDTADPLDSAIVGRAAAMVELRQRIRTVAAAPMDVLVLGETGTGKELVARALHDLSPREDKPFVTVNLAALPPGTVESELFGHAAGAFPGALRGRVGRFEHARGGTLFLDEIGAAPLALQVKLLRAVEDRAIEPLGSNERVELDLRFIASTKEDLEELVAEGRFRDDLLYRLNAVTLQVPPLRDRPEDAPRLFQHFVSAAASRDRREAPEIPPESFLALSAAEWRGNVRELKNAAERFVLGLGIEETGAEGQPATLAEQVDRFEKSAIAAALAASGGNLKATHETLGLSRKTLYEKMQKHQLKREDFLAKAE